jgi:hypothetical protein
MTLSWNEIKDRAVKFSKEWADTKNEEADAKPFLVEFFNVFGINRKKVASFEHRVKKLDDKDGYIDLLWKATILVEMKSRGKSLDKAYQQARDYLHGLKQHELPKYILISDFDIFRLYDIEEDSLIEFKLDDFVNNVQHFGYIIGYQKKVYKEQDPANIKAAELMGKLHDRLKEIGYTGHSLEVYLVRLLFCLFAEDTTIFNKQQFQDYIDLRTNEDGSDLAPKLQELFQVLNTANDKRFKNLDEQLNDFPYVNGKLFEEILPTASFDTKMRQALLDCCYIDWSKISPAIFGSMFQSVMNPQERRNLGAHYTSETNILKLIKPLFLDELWKEFESVKTNKNKLAEFHKKISELKFLDPACGCGNFLVITYRELRLLEIEILRATYKSGQGVLDIREIIWLDVDMMSGIEYEEFPARIAEVAMWLIDHQMNMLISNEFGQYFARLPLKKSAKIIHGDALEVDWEEVISKDKLSYIVGNPPFIGSKIMSQTQRNQIVKEFDNIKGCGVLDYVSGWYIKSAKYIQNTKIRVAFVSTNSIVQGEQTSILWGQMLNKYNIKIHFAHRTFRWSNEAKGNAGVYCVIIGFANYDIKDKSIFEYEDIKGEPHEIKSNNINPYLVDADNILITKRTITLCDVPKMFKGSQPTDGGNFLFTEEEKNDFLSLEPKANKYIKQLISAHEFINGEKRFCLWLVDAEPSELKQMPHLLKRIEGVKQMRLKSSKQATVKWAEQPTLFTENRQPKSNYILIPSHSSENRKYIPLGFMTKEDILNNSCLSVPDATLYHFGVLTSLIHLTWVKSVCGRLESRFRYSNEIVYNNFPWPENPSDKQIQTIEEKAQKVLDVRAEFPKSSLADLYSPLTMPPTLIKAHNELDKAVDSAYSKQNFTSEAKRMEFLFELYEKYTSNLFTKEKVKKTKKATV